MKATKASLRFSAALLRPNHMAIQLTSNSQVLLAVLASPPLRTRGSRTLARLEQVAEILGYEQVEIVNLISVPTDTVLDVTRVGCERAPWLASRSSIISGLVRASAALLGWGLTEPSGPARLHHRSQVEWLSRELAQRTIPLWTVGGAPRHPSRWQRHTSRASPGILFSAALAQELKAHRDVLSIRRPASTKTL